MKKELILVIDFGGQYNQLIARRVRECNVYCEVHPYTLSVEEIKEMNPKGIIFTGGPNSVYGEDSPLCDKALFEIGVPILGICYGSQLMSHMLGGKVATAPVSEYGKTEVDVKVDSKLFDGVSSKTICWMSHTDYIEKAPEGFKITGNTPVCPVAAMECEEKNLYAVQFHPEVMHTQEGTKMLNNFVYNVCGCCGDWKMDSFVEKTIEEIRAKVGNGKALCALSGGVDSSVAAVLLSKAIGKQLTCVFVDHGLLRKNEGDEVEAIFGPNGNYDLNFIRVNAQERFYEKLAGVEDPETKRKIIGEEFIRVFEEEAKKIGAVDFLVQGTIYPDVIESGLGKSAVIKSHHNVGGLPDYVDFKEIIEPLRLLFKDEVRKAGLELAIPEKLVYRQPFPGPGLGIRIIGEVTAEKVRIVQDADAIYREEIANAGIDKEIGQYFAALTNMRSVGVMGDERTYDYAIALRAVTTSDFMTAESADLPWEVLGKVTTRIVNEVKGVNRVMYDCTGKPPATIEFE
ncbi:MULTISPECIES: glutamine-hydrolyzing GMP synthase [Clostridium]|uniref:glutamine-hydrolyzing GMP synthase n=1 Tax=Clostridium TaxID=1485 RepID=UPI0002CCA66B|nr:MULTISPECIES: glutamine-hydrolyzing GMP synthase [Clostridium]EMU53273.1 GMP synthase (glutamine-hydrolyzing) [Clostridium butyricum DKU-01]KIU09395.1 GMP synthase [Clostridium butyricum]MBA8965721.1 GMP synthase (glutamine-hydrolysing) [Clostridium butyricum]MBA8969722.1 GMP synthase (glutamine-hydrolysing) [Clostridium butyricum]MBC2427086.1 glutamine-hydrolyzing GMP synthase [Clostridium butyricum]